MDGTRQKDSPKDRQERSAPRIPQSTPTETLARSTFTTLMWALSYPGRTFTLQGQAKQSTSAATYASCVAIGHTLLDLESSFFTPDPQLSVALARTGARIAAAESAAYHFYPGFRNLQQSEDMLPLLAAAQVGSLLYPDQSATIIIGCKIGLGLSMRWYGPGIAGETALMIGGLPSAFWQLRSDHIAYPLGWDLFLVDGDQIVGLPRTTIVEIEGDGVDGSEVGGNEGLKAANHIHKKGGNRESEA